MYQKCYTVHECIVRPDDIIVAGAQGWHVPLECGTLHHANWLEGSPNTSFSTSFQNTLIIRYQMYYNKIKANRTQHTCCRTFTYQKCKVLTEFGLACFLLQQQPSCVLLHAGSQCPLQCARILTQTRSGLTWVWTYWLYPHTNKTK